MGEISINDKQLVLNSTSGTMTIGQFLTLIYSGATQVVLQCDTNGLLYINKPIRLNRNEVKSGATQVAAGAAAGEFWFTSGHATLPDNVLMIGA